MMGVLFGGGIAIGVHTSVPDCDLIGGRLYTAPALLQVISLYTHRGDDNNIINDYAAWREVHWESVQHWSSASD